MSAIRLSLPALGERARDAASLLSLSLLTVAGRRYWIAPLLPLLWIVFQIVRPLVGWRPEGYTPAAPQTPLIRLPVGHPPGHPRGRRGVALHARPRGTGRRVRTFPSPPARAPPRVPPKQ